MSYKRNSVFYGWWVVLTSAVGLFWGVPISAYSFSVFFKPVMIEFHASRTAVSLAYTLKLLTAALCAASIGWLTDRYGARRVILIGTGVFDSILLANRLFSVIRELSEPAIAAITTAISDAPATCKMIIVPLRGAVSRVNVSDMAYALRQPGYEIDMAGIWSASAERSEAVRWVNAARDALQPFAHGVYVNQLGDTSDQLVRSAYGPNYARLMELKKKYDPNNVLRLNQNIEPS